MENYIKEVKLKNDLSVTLRLLLEKDLPQLISFYQNLPLEDRLYLRSDVMDEKNIIKRYGKLNYKYVYPIGVIYNSEIVAECTLFRDEFGWKRNLGEIRFVVKPDFQQKGLCTILIREIFFQAIKTDLYKIQAEVMENQTSAIFALEKMGFVKEALLVKHVLDINNNRQNLMIFSLDIQRLWYLMEDLVQGKSYVV